MDRIARAPQADDDAAVLIDIVVYDGLDDTVGP
jgi:hypothetical protein